MPRRRPRRNRRVQSAAVPAGYAWGAVSNTDISLGVSADYLREALSLQIRREYRMFGRNTINRGTIKALEYLKRRLVRAIRTRYPNSENFIRAPYVKRISNNSSGVIAEVGLKSEGITDATTGRPLAQYMAALQSPTQGPLRGQGTSTGGGYRGRKTTNPPVPPLVYKNPETGKWVFTQRFKKRILPWAMKNIGGDPKEVWIDAMNIAIHISQEGARRSAVWTHIFKPWNKHDGTLLNAVRSEVGRVMVGSFSRLGVTIGRDAFPKEARALRGKPFSSFRAQRGRDLGYF